MYPAYDCMMSALRSVRRLDNFDIGEILYVRLRPNTVLQQLDVGQDLFAPRGDIDPYDRVSCPHRTNHAMEIGWWKS